MIIRTCFFVNGKNLDAALVASHILAVGNKNKCLEAREMLVIEKCITSDHQIAVAVNFTTNWFDMGGCDAGEDMKFFEGAVMGLTGADSCVFCYVPEDDEEVLGEGNSEGDDFCFFNKPIPGNFSKWLARWFPGASKPKGVYPCAESLREIIQNYQRKYAAGN
jgi:hypothetical protein